MNSAKDLSAKKATKKNAKASTKFKVTKNTRVEVHALVQNAAKPIAPVWPLETFIACNPLQGLESENFEQALSKGGLNTARLQNNIALEQVNQQMIKWCGSFLDAGQGTIEMPYRDKGFYYGFMKLACFDRQLHKNQKDSKKFLQNLPASAEETIIFCLNRLEVSAVQAEEFLAQTLAYLPGWAGYVKWKTDWQKVKTSAFDTVNLVDFMAVRLVLTCLLWPNAAAADNVTVDSAKIEEVLSQLKKNESEYQSKLLNAVVPAIQGQELAQKRRDAQLVFCIDVRSEPFRRSIEAQGNYETLGFAGFFGIPIRVNDLESEGVKNCCPVLLEPRYSVDEAPVAANCDTIERYKSGKEFIKTYKNIYHQLKQNFSTPFALVEFLGFWFGLNMAFKSIAPRLSKSFANAVKNIITPRLATKPEFDLSDSNTDIGISFSEQVTYAETVLRLMGLTKGFAKVVVLCGHGSTTENNPYASALDCGACGGNHGGINAKLLSAILNKQEVRWKLEESGINIPLDTVFYGALHNTTTDMVELYTENAPQPIYSDVLENLQSDLKTARVLTNEERGVKLNTVTPITDTLRRSSDWSETRHEWGLAQNAAFIVASRKHTKNVNLDGRCFLHSYEWEQDEDGSLLETILTAPMVVAQWINSQYLFSTIDNVAYGSGSKVTQNVVGKIGIMQGNGSDLMHGLPLQSVMSSDTTAYHCPQRLLALIHAPKDRVFALIEKQSILKTLFFNEWVHLVVVDPSDNQSYKLSKDGEWKLA